eukprot:UN22868
MIQKKISDPDKSLSKRENEWLDKYYNENNKHLPNIKFTNLPIYKQSEMKFVLRNHTAVPSKYTCTFDESEIIPGIKELVNELKEQTMLTQDVLPQSNKKYSNTPTLLTSEGTTVATTIVTHVEKEGETKRSRPNSRAKKFSKKLTEQLQDTTYGFANDNGKKYLREKIQQGKIQDILKGKGASFVVFPQSGSIDPWSTTTISVFVFNDMCGHFQDRLKCEIEGLNPVWLDCSVNVVGCPLSFSPCNIGLKF